MQVKKNQLFAKSTIESTVVKHLCCRSLEASPVPLQDPDVVFLVIDSRVKHTLSGSEYPQRRSQCEKVARFLNKQFLRDVSREELEGMVPNKSLQMFAFPFKQTQFSVSLGDI